MTYFVFVVIATISFLVSLFLIFWLADRLKERK